MQMQKTYRIANSQDSTTKLYNSTINLESSQQPFKLGDWATLISCKCYNPYQSSGYLFIKYIEKSSNKVTVFNYQPVNVASTEDLLYQLNNNQLAPYAQFNITNNIMSMTLQTNALNDLTKYDISIYSTGNTSILLGCLSTFTSVSTSTQPATIKTNTQTVYFSNNNAFRIKYIRLTSQNLYGSFQCVSTYQMDSSTIAVMSQTDNFTFINKNLDTQMQISNQGNPYVFELVDQDNNPVNILQCFIEIQFFQESYFQLHPDERHTKQQVFINVPSGSFQLDLSKSIKQYSIVGVWGQLTNLQLTQGNSRFTWSQDTLTLYDQPEFLGFRNRLLSYDIFPQLQSMLRRLSGDNTLTIQYNDPTTRYPYGSLYVDHQALPRTFYIDQTNLLYGLLTSNPTFTILSVPETWTYTLNQSNLFRYSTLYNIYCGDDVLPIKQLMTTTLTVQPLENFTWTWQYPSQSNRINFRIDQYIQNSYMQQSKTTFQLPSPFILRLFIK